MPIRILCHAAQGSKIGLWAYEVMYFKEDGNSENEIWNADSNQVENTTLTQMQLKSVLEAFWYLNSLTGKLKPDTNKVRLFIPSKQILKWLKRDYEISDYPTKREKVSRLYRDYCHEIWKEMKPWDIEYIVVGKEIPEWILTQYGWN